MSLNPLRYFHTLASQNVKTEKIRCKKWMDEEKKIKKNDEKIVSFA